MLLYDMVELKDKVFEVLSMGLKEICLSSPSLVMDNEIKNLNISLCFLQCGLLDHPLLRTMALGKKRYESYWSNGDVMG